MTPFFANAGVPMIFVTLPAMIYLLAPVILIEWWAARRLIQRETAGNRWFGIGVANLLSTFVGWPLAWLLLVVAQMSTGGGAAHGLGSPLRVILAVTQQAPWLIPYEDQLYWMVPTAMAVLLVPFFFVSVYTERWILRWVWRQADADSVRRFSWVGHLYSYGFLLIVVAVYAAWSIHHA